MGNRRPTSSSVITTSSACRHVAMLPFLVQIFPNEESTNLIPVPWMLASSRPVSRNRSSRPQERPLPRLLREEEPDAWKVAELPTAPPPLLHPFPTSDPRVGHPRACTREQTL